MRWLFPIFLCGFLAAGCGGASKASPEPPPAVIGTPLPSPPPPSPAETETGLIVTPDSRLHGHVALVNAKARYVVVSYPIGSLPQVEDVLGVFRNGLKVGEIRITGPRRDFNIAGDILKGECEVGDEVRPE